MQPGIRILPVVSSAAAVPIVKAASFAFGDTALQREAVFAVGGNEWQAQDARKRFEILFCGYKE